MIAPKNESKPRKPFPAGVSNARLQILADLGVQLFQGKDPTRKLLFVFESTKHFDTFDEQKGPEPLIIMHELAFFMNGSNPSKKPKLRQFIEGWRGPLTEEAARTFDLEQLVGAPATLSVIHQSKATGGIRATIMCANDPEEGVKVPVMRGKPVCYEIGMKEGGTFTQLPPWIQKKVRESVDLTGTSAGAEQSPFVPEGGGDEETDSIPF